MHRRDAGCGNSSSKKKCCDGCNARHCSDDLSDVTEPVLPNDIANGLVDGTLPAADVPVSVQGASAVLRAAHQPATEDELLGIAALVQRFTAQVVECSAATTHRSLPMFNARIPRRVAAIVAVTLLAAGTAAASAGGAFSSSSAPEIQTAALLDGSTTTEAPTTSTTEAATTSTTEEPTTTEAADGPTTAAAVQDPTTIAADSGPGTHEDSHLYGKCTAFTHGNAKDLTNPSFSELQTNATAANMSVADYCAGVIAAHKAADATDNADDPADNAVDPADNAVDPADNAVDPADNAGKTRDTASGHSHDVSSHSDSGSSHSDGGHGHGSDD